MELCQKRWLLEWISPAAMYQRYVYIKSYRDGEWDEKIQAGRGTIFGNNSELIYPSAYGTFFFEMWEKSTTYTTRKEKESRLSQLMFSAKQQKKKRVHKITSNAKMKINKSVKAKGFVSFSVSQNLFTILLALVLSSIQFFSSFSFFL